MKITTFFPFHCVRVYNFWLSVGHHQQFVSITDFRPLKGTESQQKSSRLFEKLIWEMFSLHRFYLFYVTFLRNGK